MGGATFNRLHVWGTNDDVLASDLNGEFNNILNNLNPAGLDGYEDTVTQMQIQTSPGGLGTESLAASLGGEIERLRFVLQRIIGASVQYWYQAPSNTLSSLAAAIGTGLPQNRIISGITTGNSSQLLCLIPFGAGTPSVTLTASSTTPFTYAIGGTAYSITASITVTGLSLATGTNTAGIVAPPYLGTAATAATLTPNPLGQQWTQVCGMYGSTISIANAGAGITGLIGKIGCFAEGASGEFFLATVQSATALTNAWRGCLWNSASTLVAGAAVTTGDAVSLLSTAWIFATTASGLAITYNNPTISAATPSGASTGDYWLNLNTTAWMTFTSTTWTQAGATLIGFAAMNTVGCVGARTFNAYVAPSNIDTLTLGINSTSQVVALSSFGQVAVNGTLNSFQDSRPLWDFTQNIQSGYAVSPSTLFFLYMRENGTPTISPVLPLQRPDMLGFYHPAETWRCLGQVNCNASTQFETPVKSFRSKPAENLQIGGWQPYFGSGPVQNYTWATASYASVLPSNSGRFAFAQFPSFALPGTASLATISLTPGLWELGGWCSGVNAGAVAENLDLGFHTSSVVTVSTTPISPAFWAPYRSTLAVGSNNMVTLPTAYFNALTATNIYLLANVEGGTIALAGFVTAKRVDDLMGDM